MTVRTCFILSGTEDIEERIEEDMLREELSRLLPDMEVSDIWPSPGAVLFGRIPQKIIMRGDYPWPTDEGLRTDYWNWPVFLDNAGRSFVLLDWDGASAEVDRLRAEGKDCFVKAIDDKLLAKRLPTGASLMDGLDDGWAYSFIDRPPCLMVQEAVTMEYEYRLIVVGGVPVTGAGVVHHLTPRDNEAVFDPKMWRSVRGEHAVDRCPRRVERYLDFARDVLARTGDRSFSLDMAEIDGQPAIIEFNAFMPGRLGLYASDVKALAAATVDHLDAVFGAGVPEPPH